MGNYSKERPEKDEEVRPILALGKTNDQIAKELKELKSKVSQLGMITCIIICRCAWIGFLWSWNLLFFLKKASMKPSSNLSTTRARSGQRKNTKLNDE